MSASSRAALAVLLALTASPTAAQDATTGRFDFGASPTAAELAKFFAIPPDGSGLPPGKGTVAAGKTVYAEKCAVCHGEKLEGVLSPEYRGDKLIGGRGSLGGPTPVKTIESYWPYATTVFDYVKRAMPIVAPGSLSDDEVYSVTAYILSEAKIVSADATLDATSLPKVEMPNRKGFVRDPRPELELYR